MVACIFEGFAVSRVLVALEILKGGVDSSSERSECGRKFQRPAAGIHALRGIQGVIGVETNNCLLVSFLKVKEEAGHEDACEPVSEGVS